VIARHYLRGWCLLDLISVMPFWMITLQWDDPFGRNTSGAPTTGIGRTTVLFRVVKLLRMLRIARVFKAARVLQRVLLDFVMNQWDGRVSHSARPPTASIALFSRGTHARVFYRWEWTFAVLKMIKLFVILAVYAHWQVGTPCMAPIAPITPHGTP
jgi:hypothetical protein